MGQPPNVRTLRAYSLALPLIVVRRLLNEAQECCDRIGERVGQRWRAAATLQASGLPEAGEERAWAGNVRPREWGRVLDDVCLV